jgi:thioredoxin-related protein
MRKPSLVIFLLTILISTYAQSSQNQYKKSLPPFDIQQANGSHFRVADLKKNQPVMLVYFDPDCDHCVLFAKELMKQINAFNNVQLVMITYVPIQSLKNFVTQLDLGKYPGIKVGTEGSSFIVRYHYNIIQFPYLALHDKNGSLFATYESEMPPIQQLAAMFNKK